MTTLHGPQTITTVVVGNACELSDRALLLEVACKENGSLGAGSNALPGGTWSFDGAELRASIAWCVEGAPPSCIQQTDTFACARQ